MVQGFDPNDPNQAQPPSQPGLEPQNDALGFSAAPKQEKYNTQYLTANLKSNRRTGQMILVAVLVAAIGGVALWASLAPEGDKPAPKAAVENPSEIPSENLGAAAPEKPDAEATP